MSRLQVFLLRWIVDCAISANGTHRFFEVVARRARKHYHEDANWTDMEDWAHERMAVGFHNARMNKQ